MWITDGVSNKVMTHLLHLKGFAGITLQNTKSLRHLCLILYLLLLYYNLKLEESKIVDSYKIF